VDTSAFDVDHQLGATAVTPTHRIATGLSHNDHRKLVSLGQMTSADPADLFLDDAGDPDITGGTLTVEKRTHPIDLSRQRTLDVHRSPSPDTFVVDLSAKRRIRPGLLVAYVDMIEVSVEHQRPSGTTTSNHAKNIADLVDLDSVITDLLHLGHDQCRKIPFLARKTGRLNETLQEMHTPIEFDEVCHKDVNSSPDSLTIRS
jgi:hypothetical protein